MTKHLLDRFKDGEELTVEELISLLEWLEKQDNSLYRVYIKAYRVLNKKRGFYG
jgi:hypothetical protein